MLNAHDSAYCMRHSQPSVDVLIRALVGDVWHARCTLGVCGRPCACGTGGVSLGPCRAAATREVPGDLWLCGSQWSRPVRRRRARETADTSSACGAGSGALVACACACTALRPPVASWAARWCAAVRRARRRPNSVYTTVTPRSLGASRACVACSVVLVGRPSAAAPGPAAPAPGELRPPSRGCLYPRSGLVFVDLVRFLNAHASFCGGRC